MIVPLVLNKRVSSGRAIVIGYIKKIPYLIIFIIRCKVPVACGTNSHGIECWIGNICIGYDRLSTRKGRWLEQEYLCSRPGWHVDKQSHEIHTSLT